MRNFVSRPKYKANDTWLANLPLVSQIGFKQSRTVRLNATKQYENLNRLSSIGSGPSSDSSLIFGYHYNEANQRIMVNLADGVYWLYRYDYLSQVVSGKKHFPDDTTMLGQQFPAGSGRRLRCGCDTKRRHISTASCRRDTSDPAPYTPPSRGGFL